MEVNKNIKLNKWFLHIDLDAFFASVEQLDNPAYRGRPVIVGGYKEDLRGVVSTASYEARKYGVHSAMPIFQAVKLCPQGIFLRGRMKRYAELSYKIMNIFKEFSPDVDQMSIDEAFVDLTGTEQLFGPPEETAMKVKQRVKELTGLTVSVGLATTKYLAKIASGYSKPDGFYFIRPGEEQSFMMSLPLKKVWGIGPKTLERLNKTGINSTKDIYEKPLDLLQFLFGSSMANFLYNIVRGKENESFTRQAKSHSISGEKTFSCDIDDIYTAETELLELAHGVMFRILKEEKFSRTVTVKIKYDDFTSVTIQKTVDNNIITLDSFFEIIKELFEEKYQKGRSIRLLGVGFDKVTSSDTPQQQSLFENKDDKKQAVEKAILDINKKHPEIQIKKARLLKSIAILFLFINIFTSPYYNNLYALDNTVSIKGAGTLLPDNKKMTFSSDNNNSTGAIFDWNINDKNKVDFNIFGSWKGELSGNFLSSFGKNNPFNVQANIPVFKQDIELSTLLTLNNQWYFEANFADNFDNNTLAIGYKGNNYLRTAKISNRNITMPDIYSAEQFGMGQAGGNTQAPGISAHWQAPSEKWSADLMVRYDMTTPKVMTFHGMNKVSDNTIPLNKFMHSYGFTFPDNSTQYFSEIKNIYIENKYGTYKDSEGKLYKKLSSSDYYFSNEKNILYISQNAQENIDDESVPSILLTFFDENIPSKIESNIGSYEEKDSFLGHIQELFSNSSKKYNLNDYSYKLIRNIENSNCLVIQNSYGFTPFLIAGFYDCGVKNNNYISIISNITKETVNNYSINIINDSFINPNEDFINLSHNFASVKNIKNNNIQFPFADIAPEIYLNLKSDANIVIQSTNYSPVNNINIGQKASSGSIQIYKNGNYFTDFIYDNKTGNITLGKDISPTDVLKIYYQDEASDYSNGNFSFGAGYFLNILPELQWDIAFTGQHPILFNDSVPTVNNLQSSYFSLTTGINYNKNNFEITDKITGFIKKSNPYDKLLVSKQNNKSTKSFELKQNSGYKTITNININGKQLNKENNKTINGHIGEKDFSLKTYTIPLEWDFTDSTKDGWAAVDIKLDSGTLLKNSSKIKVMLKLDSPITVQNIDFYIQLGISAGDEETQDINTIRTFKIPKNAVNGINYNSTEWQEISINITDKDRSYLISNYDLRLIVIQNEKNGDSELKNKISFGPYTISEESIFTIADEQLNIETSSIPSGSDNYSAEISWTFNKEDADKIPNKEITAASYFSPADFNLYNSINFKFAYKKDKIIDPNDSSQSALKNEPNLTITLDSGSLSLNGIGNEAIKIIIDDIYDFIDETKTYHLLTVNINDNSIFIDGIKLSPDKAHINILNKNIVPSRVVFKINPFTTKKIISSGSFYVDNIFYEDNKINFGMENYVNTKYRKDNILKINNFSLFENGYISGSSTQKFENSNINILSNFDSGITIAGITLQADFRMNQEKFINAGHSIVTSKPLFNILSLSENYRWDINNNVKKDNSINASFSTLQIPIIIKSRIISEINNNYSNHNHETSLSGDFLINNVQFNITSILSNAEHMNLQNQKDHNYFNNNYFKDWYNITKYEFSIGNKLADRRTSSFNNNINFGIKNNLISPSISYNLSTIYENTNFTTFYDTSFISIDLPITLKNYFISFGLSKKASNTNYIEEGGSYFSDMEKMFQNQTKKSYFYTSIPFYDLFDKNIRNKLKGTYTTKYELNFKKKLFNSFKDLYIPSAVNFTITRDSVMKDKFSDIYQVKTTLTNRSINNFGRNSSKHIFGWFEQEEIVSSLTAIFKIPTDETKNMSYDISSYLQIMFMLNEDSILNTAFDFTISTNNQWKTKGTFVYSRNGKSSFIIEIAKLISDKIANVDFDFIRKDSFNYEIGAFDKVLKQQYEYFHTLDIKFLTNYTVTTGMGLTFSHIQNKASALSLNYSIGGKISF